MCVNSVGLLPTELIEYIAENELPTNSDFKFTDSVTVLLFRLNKKFRKLCRYLTLVDHSAQVCIIGKLKQIREFYIFSFFEKKI